MSYINPRILFTCGREGEYVRNVLVRRALRQHFDLLEVIDNEPGSLLLRNLRLIPRLLPALRTPHDLIFVGFYGHLLTPFLRHLTRKPILFDAFLSTWDTLCYDRELFAPQSLPGRVAYRIDRQSGLAAQHVLLDTQAQCQYMSDTFGLPATKLSAYYVGYDEEVFSLQPESEVDQPFTVFFYGSFVPLQGVEYIVQAAKLLENEHDLQFRIIGEGMTYRKVRHWADQLHVPALTFQPAVPYRQLRDAIAKASLCLGGPFGASSKAQRVIAGKTFQFLTMGKPTIVGDSPANREVFIHGEDVWMVPPADAQALALAILQLRRDSTLRESIAHRGYQHCQEQFNMDAQAQRLQQLVLGML